MTCKEKQNNNGICPLHNLQCGWPKCNEPAQQEPVAFEMDWPDYHTEAMGCGLEDRNITDRYEAMLHGWECAIERVAERLPEVLYESPPQRKPLTDEQRKHVIEMWRGGNWTAGDIIDAVEAAHGIKEET